MLTVRYENCADAQKIYRAIGLDETSEGTNFVMYDEQTPVAVWRMRVLLENEPIGLIERVAFAEGVDIKDKLFFVHTVFFKLIDGAPIKLRFNGVRPELERFGFGAQNGNMEIISKNIDLHYMCGGK